MTCPSRRRRRPGRAWTHLAPGADSGVGSGRPEPGQEAIGDRAGGAEVVIQGGAMFIVRGTGAVLALLGGLLWGSCAWGEESVSRVAGTSAEFVLSLESYVMQPADNIVSARMRTDGRRRYCQDTC